MFRPWFGPRIIRRLIAIILLCSVMLLMSYGIFIGSSRNLDEADRSENSTMKQLLRLSEKDLKNAQKVVTSRNLRALDKIRALSEAKTFKYIILVQTHDRLLYLKALLESLAATKNIEDALVIFSHDVVDQKIDSLITETDVPFEVVQIYFPHSLQLNPDQFPGAGPQDCPDRIKKTEATKRRCTSYDHPDSYGHYRTPQICQVKHHWWWKFQFVFHKVPDASKNALVIFVEEDHFFLPDALVLLDQLTALKPTECEKGCSLVSIAHHKANLADGANAYQEYGQGEWIGSRDNIGLVFDYNHFKAVNQCADEFCTIDDYNWDWSFYFLLKGCLSKQTFPMLIPIAPRVLHIGDCGGIHHKAATCNPEESIRKAQDKVAHVHSKLFPSKLTKSSQKFPRHKDTKVNGGWGDPRDWELCRNFTKMFVDEER